MFSGLNDDLHDEIQTYLYFGQANFGFSPIGVLWIQFFFSRNFFSNSHVGLEYYLSFLSYEECFFTTYILQLLTSRQNRGVLHLFLSRDQEQFDGRSKMATCAQGRQCFWFHFSKVCPMRRGETLLSDCVQRLT